MNRVRSVSISGNVFRLNSWDISRRFVTDANEDDESDGDDDSVVVGLFVREINTSVSKRPIIKLKKKSLKIYDILFDLI